MQLLSFTSLNVIYFLKYKILSTLLLVYSIEFQCCIKNVLKNIRKNGAAFVYSKRKHVTDSAGFTIYISLGLLWYIFFLRNMDSPLQLVSADEEG